MLMSDDIRYTGKSWNPSKPPLAGDLITFAVKQRYSVTHSVVFGTTEGGVSLGGHS